ncbi:hypothetical protein IWX90DRAFT_97134 [Phyllosticta citrichinensis]|uniref:Uncharacterized protein n=1 Tax=Phyllosticta citrichinensis TaxID=1130410 RepID=A0ABR1Y1B3_9PEZI
MLLHLLPRGSRIFCHASAEFAQLRPALGRTNHTSPRYPNSSNTRDSRPRLYKCPTRLPLRATHSRATTESKDTESSTKKAPSRARGMVGDIPAGRIVHFPIRQDGGTALRGRAFKQAHIRKPSPSEHLVEVLKRAHQLHAVPPEFANKADLSYYSSSQVPPRGGKPVLVLHPTPKPSMQYFVAESIRLLCDPAQRNVSGVYISPKVRSWIESKGYAWQDLKLWVNVLVAKSSDDSVSLLRGGYAKGPTPIWVVLFLLRRERLTLGAFRHLLRFSLGRVGLVEYPDGRHQFQDDLTIDEKTVFLLFLRLLRHARHILPSAIVPLTKLITAKINPRNIGTQHSEVPNEQISEAKMTDMRVKLAHIYNKALKLLSLPSTQNPYASAAHQERAQFEILRRIAEYEPPIPVTEDGYRALIRIQLSHVKTDKERLWASLKSKGWPPWKEDRTAMDEDILPEDAISRAGQLLRKMGEAGYPATSSDQAASILTGWDLDDSPTIQTRTIHYPQAHTSDETKSSTDLQGPSPPPQEVLDPAIWAARVRSTRTLEEAWACFLAYDVSNAPQDQQVYHVMFEKIVADRRRRRKQKDARHVDMPFHGSEWKEPVPGDSTDVWPVPKSYRDRVDPMLKPPDTKELLDRMTSKGVTPSARCLEFVVQTAANYTEAWYAIKHFHGSKPSMLPLLKRDMTPEQAALIPDGIFRAYILLLTRLWYRPLSIRLNVPQHENPLLIHRALDLLSLKKSNDRKCWNSVLYGLSQHGLYNLKDTSAGIMRDAIETMSKLEVELDQEGFGIICKAFNMRAIERENNVKARREALTKITAAEDLLKSAKDIQREWDDHLEHCSADSRYLRTLFNHLVGTEPQKSSEALGGMQIPIPHIMHRYIQSLGIMYDFEGLLSVADFLKRNTSMFVFNAKYSINGSVRLRLAVVCLRVHLEFRSHVHYDKSKAHDAPGNLKINNSNNNTWTSPGHYFDSNPAAAETLLVMPRHSEEQVALARLKLDDADARGLGGWPSDEEVHRYLLNSSGMRVQPASPPADETDPKPLYPNLM